MSIPTQPPQIPQPPNDQEHLNVIDRFALFCAKNGPSFEEVTRQKQFGNPKFAFLFGGEYSDYYKYRLMMEIQNLQSTGGFLPPLPAGPPPLPVAVVEQSPEEKRLENQITILRKQIADSESNLNAQETAQNATKQAKVEALWKLRDDKRIADLIKQVGLNISAFEKLVDHMQTSGSKETISNSKKWIFDNCNSDRLREIILTYLLHRVRSRTATDPFRLHVLYLINDWAHYCQRKKQDTIRQMLSRYVPKLYAFASTSSTLDHNYSEKLDKLIGVWEGHKYFDENCYKQLRNPATIMAAEQTSSFAEQQQVAAEIDKEISDMLSGFKRQHQEYEKHILTQIVELEMKLQQLREAEAKEHQRLAELEVQRQQQQQRELESKRRSSRFDQPPSHKIPSLLDSMAPESSHFFPPPPLAQPPQQIRPIYKEDDLIPKCPYYELPAGMMVPLVAQEDVTFKPLKEENLRLPPPEPPNEFLIRELDRFYNMPVIEPGRENDGWEMNGLLEHYVKKAEHRVKLETKLKSEGKTFEDAITNRYVPPTEQEQEKWRIRASSKSRSRSSSSSSSSSRSSSSSSSGSSRSSRSRSRSASPVRKRRQRSRSVSPDDQRPSFSSAQQGVTGGFLAPLAPTRSTPIQFKMPALPLNREQNKGAQLMTKMGWEGRGLGREEQGREEPIDAGQPRDKQDLYRGVGSQEDIYDNYRKVMAIKKAGRY